MNYVVFACCCLLSKIFSMNCKWQFAFEFGFSPIHYPFLGGAEVGDSEVDYFGLCLLGSCGWS
jgi:hypothetical protein